MSSVPQGGPNHPVVVDPLASRFLSFPAAVTLEEPGGLCQGATHPLGFIAGGAAAGLKDSGRPDVGVLAVAPEWRSQATSAAVFTTNAFAAAPIMMSRSESRLEGLVAVAVNSGNANACTGGPGLAVARAMRQACADGVGVDVDRVAVGSTGIIGVPLDAGRMANGVALAAGALSPNGGPEFNRSIITTDRFPKVCALTVETPAGTVRLGVCGKGAGMIAPAMATMICVVTTDAIVGAGDLRRMLVKAVGSSFNRITVDGEMSTNDMVLFLASGASGVEPSGTSLQLVEEALTAMLLWVALMMVADGEGATKVMRLRVGGAETEASAITVARAIAGSPLVKTAMHGGDPNWGRIMSSAGAALAGRSLPQVTLELGGVRVVENSAALPVSAEDRERMTAAVRAPEVDISLDLGLGAASTQLFFADMGHEYITINAEYHT